jgi:hypothetical protein
VSIHLQVQNLDMSWRTIGTYPDSELTGAMSRGESEGASAKYNGRVRIQDDELRIIWKYPKPECFSIILCHECFEIKEKQKGQRTCFKCDSQFITTRFVNEHGVCSIEQAIDFWIKEMTKERDKLNKILENMNDPHQQKK